MTSPPAPANATSNNSLTTISKRDSEDDAWASHGHSYINPFVHRINIESPIELAKVYMLTVILLPLRVMGCVISLFSAWIFSFIGLYGLTLDDLKEKPLSGWRKKIQTLTATSMRMVYACGSFHHIVVKGTPASSKDAPILVVAPHSSYVDSIIVVTGNPPSIVAKRETADIPLLGRIINYSQPIYVQREDPNSRQNTIREIVARARSSENWPQVVIFAEGTCTNRSALIKFKPGAFYPGVPVQPVLLKYPNKFDTFTWTWDGPGVFRLLWLTMAQFYNCCEIEYLPVYNPSEAEKSDANLFAHNVRDVMANSLGVPTSDYSFEDVIIMNRARDMHIPFPGDIVEIEHTLHNLGLIESERDTELIKDFTKMTNTDKLDFITFSELIKVELNNPYLRKLFALLDHRRRGCVSLKSFLLCSLFCKLHNDPLIDFMRAVVNIYCENEECINRETLMKIVRHANDKITEDKLNAIFLAVDQDNMGCISFTNFENYIKNDHARFGFMFASQERLRRKIKID